MSWNRYEFITTFSRSTSPQIPSLHYWVDRTSGMMLKHLVAICLSLASLLAAVPLEPTIRSDNGVSGDANTASLSCGSQYISCCTDDSSACNLAIGWDGDLGKP